MLKSWVPNFKSKHHKHDRILFDFRMVFRALSAWQMSVDRRDCVLTDRCMTNGRGRFRVSRFGVEGLRGFLSSTLLPFLF